MILDFNFFESSDGLWVGETIKDQRSADEKIPQLLKIQAVVRFLIFSRPLIGPIVFDNGWSVRGHPWGENGMPKGFSQGIDFVVIKDEASPYTPAIIQQCEEAGVAVYYSEGPQP